MALISYFKTEKNPTVTSRPMGAPAFKRGGMPIAGSPWDGRLAQMFQDPTFDFSDGPVGPSIEDDTAAYSNFLNAGEAARSREERRATEGILDSLQGRGLATSGISIKDVVEHVLGPSLERGSNLAAQFGLEQARRRSDLLESERNAARDINKARLGGRLGALFNDQNAYYEMQRIERRRQIEDQRAKEERSRRRKGALLGVVGGILGAAAGGPLGAYTGQELGQSFAY